MLRAGDFSADHLNRSGVYVVCFGATWCRPTRGFVPKFVDRNGHLPATLAMADISEWEDPLWETFRIKITPTIVVFRDGASIGRLEGRRFFGLREADLDQLAQMLRSGPSSERTASSSPP